MTPDAQLLSMMRNQVAAIILGSIFLFIGGSALVITLLRNRRDVGLLVWFGVFSGLYGARMLAQAPAAFGLLPASVWTCRPYVIAIITYTIFVPALLFWLELSIGGFRRFVQLELVAATLFAVAGTAAALIRHEPDIYMQQNSEFAIFLTLVIAAVNGVPSLARRFLREPSPMLAAGSLVLAVAALLNNLGSFLPLPNFQKFEPIAFAIFVFSLGYVAAQHVFTNERRLVGIENELDIAREIQQSTLPTSVPQIGQLRIAASYLPMTAVAGDFYEFLHLDEHRAGFLVADVSGHGVPAALIASMIKVAMHSVATHAAEPARVMSGLNQILSHQLRGQFVTAAYLYIDLESRQALYSAAGHPPLLYWKSASQKLERLESNGLLFGVLKESAYPMRNLTFSRGDRFLLYTDGLVEAENAGGEPFGDQQLERLISSHPELPATELSALLLEKLSAWQPRSTSQQDDVTLVIIDAL